MIMLECSAVTPILKLTDVKIKNSEDACLQVSLPVFSSLLVENSKYFMWNDTFILKPKMRVLVH